MNSEHISDEDVPLSTVRILNRKKSNKKRKIVEDDEAEMKSDLDSDTTLAQMTETNKDALPSSSSSPSGVSPVRKFQKVKIEKSTKKAKIKAETTAVKNDERDEVVDKKKELKIKKEESVGEEEENEEVEEEEYRWWENDENDGSVQWTTFRHNGVMFPPPYQPLPSHIKLYYEGEAVELPSEAEEVAGFYAHLLETEHAKNPVFQENFFEDFLQVLKENGGARNGIEIKKFSKCDFGKIHEYFVILKEAKAKLSPQEKKRLRCDKEKESEPFKFCEIDGRKEQVGNFRVEPPDLFRGRGAHPKTGKLKRRVLPEDIILNLDKDAPVPELRDGHRWGEIKHDNTVQWLAMWRENISNTPKYVRLAANSSFKGQSDFKKFEKARELKKYIDSIRRDYRKNLKSKLMVERQKAVAIYLIDVFALRAGGEKSEDEADTVGCCSLRFEHVTLKPPNTVIFDFLGKDSIRFYQEVEVDKQVFKNLSIFKKAPKKPGDQLFDRLDPPTLNKYLQNYMSGLTAKVFRTYNASKTMQDQLDLIANQGSIAEKLLKYNAANRTVAILCNHQRTVGKNHAAAMQKANHRIREMEWHKIRLKRTILQLDPSQLETRPEYFAEIDDIGREELAQLQETVIERELQRCRAKFQRENNKRKFNDEEPLGEETLRQWESKVEAKRKEYADERQGKQIKIASTTSMDKLETQVSRLCSRIETNAIQLQDKQENSQVSLGTSKINYIDPRLSVVFCKKYAVPLEKVFTKTLRDKFRWAIESVDENWRF